MYNLFRDSSAKLIAMISEFLRTAFLVAGLVPALLAFAAVDPLASEVDLVGRAERDNWGVPTMFGRKGSATVVDPPVSAPERAVFSLNGDWEILADERSIPFGAKPFNIDGVPGDPGYCATFLDSEERWRRFLEVGAYHGGGKGQVRKVRIPGFWEPQGIGKTRIGRAWDSPDRGEFMFKHAFVGIALLRRTFDAPAAWTGRRLWFKVGGVQGLAYFWINGRPAVVVRQSCGSYKFDVTDLVTPGKPFQVIAYVQADGPTKFGCWNAIHHMSGFYRGLEIEATDDVWLDDVWCRGDVSRKEAEIHVSLRGVTRGERLQVTATLGDASTSREMAPGEDAVLRLPLPGGRLWSPECPNLHTARVAVVRGGRTVGAWHERFGVRALAVKNGEFLLNGRPFYVRGCGNHGRDALTLVVEADRAKLRHQVAQMRRAGFNQTRHHTHCPYPEYFDAADELGLLVQPELPYAAGGPCEAIPYAPLFDLKEYVRTLRRHPSFAMLSMGNEGHMASCDRDLYDWMKAHDPDRLVLHNDGGRNTAENSDFSTGPTTEWHDSKTAWRRPYLAHEYLNLGIKEDPRDTDRYTGMLGAPRTWAQFDEGLVRAQLTRLWGLRCTDAAQRLQAFYEKRGLEAARADPTCSGYSFWSICDAGASTTGPSVAQGYFNAFWEPKRSGLAPEAFARFNGPDALLLKPASAAPILVSGGRYAADVLLAAYGERDLAGTAVAWRLVAGRAVLASGEAAVCGSLAAGAARKVAALDFAVPAVAEAVHAKLEVSLDGVANDWDLWIFPKRERKDGSRLAVHPSFLPAFTNLYDNVAALGTPAAAGRLLRVLPWMPDAPAAAAGQRTLFLSQMGGAPNVGLGWWWLGDQVGTAFLDHPALDGLPHDGCLSPLFFRLLKRGRPLPFAPVPREKLIAVGEGRDAYFCYLGGDETALYAFGLDVLNGHPEATSLLDGLVDYCLSATGNIK